MTGWRLLLTRPAAECEALAAAAVEEFGRIDVLINNAGILGGMAALEALSQRIGWSVF